MREVTVCIDGIVYEIDECEEEANLLLFHMASFRDDEGKERSEQFQLLLEKLKEMV